MGHFDAGDKVSHGIKNSDGYETIHRSARYPAVVDKAKAAEMFAAERLKAAFASAAAGAVQ